MKLIISIIALLFSSVAFSHYNGSEHFHNRGLYDRGHRSNDYEVWCPRSSMHEHYNVYYEHAHYYVPHRHRHHRNFHDRHRHNRHERIRKQHRRIHRSHVNRYYHNRYTCVSNRHVQLCFE